MFGSLGGSEILIVLVIAGLASVVARQGALAASGPVLVLRKLEVNDAGSPAVVIEGRPSGFMAWLLTTVGLDTLTTLKVTDHEVSFRSAGLSGEIHHVVPSAAISSTHCGYSQPIWLLVVGGVLLLFSLVVALSSPGGAGTLLGGVVMAGACAAIYMLQRKIAISIETTGGMVMGLAFKPSAIEQVSVNLAGALRAVDRINGIVVARSHRVGSL